MKEVTSTTKTLTDISRAGLESIKTGSQEAFKESVK